MNTRVGDTCPSSVLLSRMMLKTRELLSYGTTVYIVTLVEDSYVKLFRSEACWARVTNKT